MTANERNRETVSVEAEVMAAVIRSCRMKWQIPPTAA